MIIYRGALNNDKILRRLLRHISARDKFINRLTKKYNKAIKTDSWAKIFSYQLLLICKHIDLFYKYGLLLRLDLHKKLKDQFVSELKLYQINFITLCHMCFLEFLFTMAANKKKVFSKKIKLCFYYKNKKAVHIIDKEYFNMLSNKCFYLLKLSLIINVYVLKSSTPQYKKSKAYLYFYYTFWGIVLDCAKNLSKYENNILLDARARAFVIASLKYIWIFFNKLYSL